MNSYIIKYILPDGKLFSTSTVQAENSSDKRLDEAVFLGFYWWQSDFDRADIYLKYAENNLKIKSYDYQHWLNNIKEEHESENTV